MSAKQEWEDKIQELAAQAPKHLAADAKYQWARSQLARRDPELRQRVLDEANRRGE